MSDPLTQLQHGLNGVSHMLFNFIGQAARDAPPVAVGDSADEKVPPSALNLEEDTRVKADQQLCRQNADAQQQLRQEYERAERKLQVAQDLFGAVAMATLQQRQARKLQQLKAEISQAP